MIENSIELKSINDILVKKDKFYIPSYQRGYRWEKRQVVDLLNDLWEFYKRTNKKKDEFYCLQPVVVKENNNKWEVIDGQQRLTSILILLNYFNQTEFKKPKPVFELEFQTRADSQSFLMNINVSLKEKNIDYFHICNAYNEISIWFDEKEKENNAVRGEFYPVLINSTKVIWYQVNDGTDPIEIFTRINIGKIPLTNAELIKALFLKSDNFDRDEANNDEKKVRYIQLKQTQIAGEWDQIEYSLHNEEFWYFLNKDKNDLPTRIEFILDIIADDINNSFSTDKQIPKEQNEYFSFIVFNQLFEIEKMKLSNDDSKTVIDVIWKIIKNYYMSFDEWFKNRELYHWIGYLVSHGEKIQDLKKASEKKTKTEFEKHLRELINNKVNYQLANLDFENNNPNKAIEKVLLLFNIETMINNKKENSRFPFDRYKKDKWSLEHIHAQNSEGLSNSDSRRAWLAEVSETLDTIEVVKDDDEQSIYVSSINEKILNLIKLDKIEKEDFEKIQHEVYSFFGEPDLHTINNLALLSGKDNSALNNSIFPVKRNRIKQLEKDGSFIPICTRNVFLKYYSTNTSHLHYWNENDRMDYFEAIKTILKDYLPQQKDTTDGNY